MQVSLNRVYKSYGEKNALADIDLFIRKGSFYGILGPNGAGKSTLLNLLAGLDLPSEGEILYGNPPTESIPNRELTMVFQSPYLLRATVEKNIAYPLSLRQWPLDEANKRVSELLTGFGLTSLRRQKAWTLSAGEKQKVALARALSFHPKILLLDEPTANLDPGTTEEMERMLLQINREEGTTILLVTHNLAQAKRLCDHAAFLYEGRILETGESHRLLTKAEHPITRKFIQGEWLI